MQARFLGSIAAALMTAMMLQGCGTLPRRAAVPADLTERATPLGIPDARFWVDGDLTPMIQDIMRQGDRERAALAAAGQSTDRLPPAYLLALSGGGDAGAFGAGLLVGWTAQGSRPEFKLVTGISAGALIAPFAFLGSQYDEILRAVSTSMGPRDAFRRRSALSGIISDGMADSAPLARLIAKYVTPEVLAAVAGEYQKGRFLLIGTTDLDAGRAVMWNMGAIASSDAPGALELFRKIMLASTSIPGVVSPVMIDVDIDGKLFQEMHVDGGAITQVYLYPRRMFAATRAAMGTSFARERHAYVIRNGQLEPHWADTKRRTLNIGGRAISTLIQTQGVSDLERIYLTAQQDGVDFNLAFIGPDFDYPHTQDFATDYMRSLFDYAYQLSVKGYPWSKSVPTHYP
jgi:predicted acylesterase/phospholipase RssA